MKQLIVLATCVALGTSFGVTAAEKSNPKTFKSEPLKVKTFDKTKAPKNILITGNSLMYYNCGMNAWLNNMIKVKLNKKMKSRIATMGGLSYDILPVEEYLYPMANKVHANKAPTKVLEAEKKWLDKNKYDMVFFQAQRFGEKQAARDEFYVKEQAKVVREYGAIPVMIMTFPSINPNKDGVLPAGMDEVAMTTIRMANQNDMYVIPAGLTFVEAAKQMKDVAFYQPDKRHPTAIGSYAMAATMYAALWQEHPKDALAFEGACGLPIPKEQRAKVCDIAWNVCKKFYGWK